MTTSTGQIMRAEWLCWGGGALFAFFLANYLMSGSVFPLMSIPFSYSGDGHFHSWMTQRVIEDWLFENSRSGYPFGSLFLDYPGSDYANHLLLKLFGLVSGSFYGAMNLYFLIGFSVTFAVTYLVLRKFGLSIALSFAGSFIFDFLPFHLLRLEHLFYTWYFVVPLFFYLGIICFNSGGVKKSPRHSPWKLVLLGTGLIAMASFGVYGALFGVILLSVAGVVGAIAHKNFRPIWWAAACVSMVTAGIILNLLPNIVHRASSEANTDITRRPLGDSEVYGLKLMQLIIPRSEHRSELLSGIASKYNQNSPLVNENSTASLGMIGAVGLLVLFTALVFRVAGGRGDDRLSFLALLVLILFLFGTIGGLGSLFANIVSPLIRGWNRISIFIGFGAIAGFLILLQIIAQRYFAPKKRKIFLAIVASALVALAFYDQTKPACLSCNEQNRRDFNSDRSFIQKIEEQLVPGAAVYQLPYMPFPEVPPLNRLPTYGLTIGFLHSRYLHWSYGGMKGRPGDLFFRQLAQEPIERQIEVIKKLGFSGIYIDRRGYPDDGAEIVAKISAALGYAPSLEDVAKKLVFFSIQGAKRIQLDELSTNEIMRTAGYHVDRLGARHKAEFFDGIDFTLSTWPEFLRDVRGISGHEPWGRWSDANIDQVVRFEFFEPMPARFTMVLSARSFGRDGEQTFVVRLGDQMHNLKLHRGETEVRIPIVLNNSKVDVIDFIPQNPVAPKDLGFSEDLRKLGIGFIKLRFEP